jgi:hypothetical protein
VSNADGEALVITRSVGFASNKNGFHVFGKQSIDEIVNTAARILICV